MSGRDSVKFTPEQVEEALQQELEIRFIRHTDDPQTSHDAAKELVESGELGRLQEWVLNMVRQEPGLTGSELAKINGVRESYDVKRRLSDLRRKNLVERRDPRPCQVTGKRASTWWPT